MRRLIPLLLLVLLSPAAAADCVPVGGWVAPGGARLDSRFLSSMSKKSVVLLGETHDSHEHHRWQLHTLAALHAQRPDLVLGFEMFPRRVQGALDRWVAGELSEAEFLAAADWRKVWNMDPALYLPLFHYARMHRIPMLALDVERGGRAAAAPRPAPPSAGYRELLERTYAQHPQSDFERFVESQTRHDRVMAQSIADALAKRPGALVVGIMGRGHVVHGYGVPHQLADLGVREVAVLLPWDRDQPCERLVAGLADAVFGVAAPEVTQRPLLGISIEQAEGGVRIAAVSKGSIAERAGLRAGDLLLEIAGRPAKDPADVREAVQRQAPGTWLPLRVRRGDKVAEIVAKFPPLHLSFSITLDPQARLLRGKDSSGKTWERTLDADAPGGVFLPGASGWYPGASGGLASYEVTLELPAGQAGLVPGTLVEETRTPEHYRARIAFPHPGEAIDLIAGPYRIEERMHKSAGGKAIRLRTYFHPEIVALSSGYLDAVAQYLDLFEKRIGEYPFGQFSVVSSPTPTGYGMPTLTYLGVEVLKLPFIRSTSLGHEVLHNWWGNGVYVDYASGNWAEGLTTFMADYAFKEREGEEAAREMRLAWLRDIAAVPPGRDEPLRAFRSRTHATSQITGYRKAAMLFFVLREALGAGAFERALRAFWREQRFRAAAWSDLQRAFESASGQDLARFFEQWLERRGAPSVRLADARAERAGDGWRVHVTLTQDSPPYALRVPVVIEVEGGKSEHVPDLDFSETEKNFLIDTNEKPIAIALDPQLRVLRRLAPGEAPPILRNAIVDPAPTLLVLSDSLETIGTELAGRLLDHHPAKVQKGERPTLVVGLHAEVDAWLAREGLPARRRKGTAQAWMAGPVAVISAQDAAALGAAARPLPHYGAQSFVFFEGARAIERGVWPSRPQALRLTTGSS